MVGGIRTGSGPILRLPLCVHLAFWPRGSPLQRPFKVSDQNPRSASLNADLDPALLFNADLGPDTGKIFNIKNIGSLFKFSDKRKT